MEIIEFGDLTHDQRADLEGDEADPFDAAGATLVYQGKDRHVGLRTDEGRLVASTGMLLVDVEVGEDTRIERGSTASSGFSTSSRPWS